MTDAVNGAELPDLFSTKPDVISLAGGLPDLSVFPSAEVAEITGRLMRLGARTLLQYTTPTVPRNLAAAIRDLTAFEGMSPQQENLIPTAGSQQGLVAVAAALPGDVILCEVPTYPGALAAFAAAELDIAPVATDHGGIIVEDVERQVVNLRAKGHTVSAVYTVPTFSNPTGASQDPSRRSVLVETCARLGLTIIEDNPYGMLGFNSEVFPSLKSLLPEKVIHLGTFSKVFAPGLRVGWIDPPHAFTQRLRTCIEIQALSPSPLSMAIIAETHRRLGWETLISSYRARYAEKARFACQILKESSEAVERWAWEDPRGGFYLWLTSLESIDTTQVSEAAAKEGVRVIPGTHFRPDGLPSPSLRICFSNATPDRLEKGLRRLIPVLNHAADLEGAMR